MHDKLLIWIREIRRYNRRLHLVSRSMESALEKQAEDTMDLMKNIREPNMADLGAGSGFLAIPYKVVYPDSRLWLIERSQKKAVFLRHVIDLLELKDIELIDFDPNERAAGPFPAVMSRSFSPRETLPGVVLSVISVPGRFYYFSTGALAPIDHPAFTLKKRFIKECKGYDLNLELYEVTSR